MTRSVGRRPNPWLSLFAWLLPSSHFKIWLLRRLGNHIGDRVVIGPNAVLGCGRFEIGNDTVLDPFNLFKGLSRVELGNRVRIGRYNQISASPEYQKHSDYVGRFIMRDVTLVTNRHYIDCSGQVLIDYHAAVGGMRTIMQSHEFDLAACHATVGRVVIGEFAMTGACCLLLKDCEVPPYSVLAAGTVMARRRDGETKRGLYGGVPARFIRELPELGWWEDDEVVRPVKPFNDDQFRGAGRCPAVGHAIRE
jgi:acetyltransferase-like isoleucine patch superfamily enzyme